MHNNESLSQVIAGIFCVLSRQEIIWLKKTSAAIRGTRSFYGPF